ncbi:MAG TPA: glutamine-synthetase adenylyltransferase, partial [Geminicoccaceae bacterium]|nr:glutamine-synthetase adenylyltransferase [Geminicoccaceae bacterium]
MSPLIELEAAALPGAGDAAAAERGLRRWPHAVSGLPADLADVAAAAGTRPGGRRLLEAVFGNSPFLTEALLAEPDVLAGLLRDGPDATAGRLLAEPGESPLGQRTRVMAALRRTRRRVALLVALADLAGLWPLERVTGTLTRFADLAIGRALAQVLGEFADRGEIEPAEPGACGLVVLGMGKLGAFELNYSSDIDLIVLFEPRRLRPRGAEGPLAASVRMTRALVHLLDAQTRDGYVFRTDLRLRPHPVGQPLALSVDHALFYYEHHGQKWERAALIKARPVAGDLEAGREFLDQLRPYLWRKHLDYAAIADIHSIKRQINAYRGHGTIKVLGHNIKVGRGGIREIEFFAQTQQLILGGRMPELRVPDT